MEAIDRCGHFPLGLGSPLRVATCAWHAWGITWRDEAAFSELVRASEDAYSSEWRGTTDGDHQVIARAAEAAGLSDANRRLNERVSAVGRQVVAQSRQSTIRILDVGAGAGTTTLALWRALGSEDRRRAQFILLDPAARALAVASKSLLEAGMGPRQFRAVEKRDLDAMPCWHREFDLIMAVAAIHHHAFLDTVFDAIANSLMPGGCVILGDWFNGLSLHPARVLDLLMALDWETKEADLEAFQRWFPLASRHPGDGTEEADERADEQIASFWQALVRTRPGDVSRFQVLEGHRRMGHYVSGLRRAGLYVPSRLPDEGSNPTSLDPTSTLLGVVAATKQ